MIDGVGDAMPFVAAGLATGVVSGTLGLSGGFMLVPLLTILGLPVHRAVGTSLAVVLFMVAAGGVSHWRQLTADPRRAALVGAAGVVGAPLGVMVSAALAPSALELVLGAFLLATAGWMLVPQPERRGPGRQRTGPAAVAVALAIGLTVGFVSGLLGTGGGFLLVPLLVLLAGLTLPVAVGTSLLAMIAPVAAGGIGHVVAHDVDGLVVVAMAPIGVLGAVAGARLAGRMSAELQRLGLATVLVTGAGKLLLAGGHVL